MRVVHFLTLTFLLAFNSILFAVDDSPQPYLQNQKVRKIFAQGKILQEGEQLVKQLKFDEAALKFQEALRPEYVEGTYYAAIHPHGLLMRTYQRAGRYEEALETSRYFTDVPNPTVAAILIKKKLEALLSWQKTGDPKPIYDFIEAYKAANKDQIPPKRADNLIMSRVAELYDLIGDYDAGIAWARSFDHWLDTHVPGWRDKSVEQEYANLIRAFEESKRGMPKVCSDDGKYCVGRATAYIIRSEYL